MASKVPKYEKPKPQRAPAVDRGVRNTSAGDRADLPILHSAANEQLLVAHVMDRIKLADVERMTRIARISAIDLQVSGDVAFSAEEKKRDNDNKKGRKPKPVSHSLPLVDAQLEEVVTYLMSLYAPDTGIFEAVAPVALQQQANAVTGALNKHSKRGQYYMHIARFCASALRYNLSAMSCFWERHEGVVFSAKGPAVEKSNGVVWEGNVLETLDAYNFFYDCTVHPVNLAARGEYFAHASVHTPFKIRQMGRQKKLVAVERFVSAKATGTPKQMAGSGLRYWKPPAAIRTGAAASGVDWVEWLSAGQLSAAGADSARAIELITFVGWLNPKEFGLAPKNDLQLWRVVVVNGQHIGFAVQVEDTNGCLPIVTAAPIIDDLGTQQRAYSEKLIPLQHFSSFLLNTHQDAVRKSVYGITIFNPNAFPGLDLTQDDLMTGLIPTRSSVDNVDIDKIFRHISTAPGTDSNVGMIENIMGIMQKIMPSNMLQQITDLDRATEYQAAATVAAGSRRNFKVARMLNTQAFDPLVELMYRNLIANGIQVDTIDPVSGEAQKFSSAQLAAIPDLSNFIGTGIRGLDKLMVVNLLFKMLNAVLQSREAGEELDIVKMMNHISSLAGDNTDIAQFKRSAEEMQARATRQAQAQAAAKPAG